jgi:hypothetical protein
MGEQIPRAMAALSFNNCATLTFIAEKTRLSTCRPLSSFRLSGHLYR